jgi:hypothetical protein
MENITETNTVVTVSASVTAVEAAIATFGQKLSGRVAALAERRAKIAAMLENADAVLASAEKALATLPHEAMEYGSKLGELGMSEGLILQAITERFPLEPVPHVPGENSAPAKKADTSPPREVKCTLTEDEQARACAIIRENPGLTFTQLREKMGEGYEKETPGFAGLKELIHNLTARRVVRFEGATKGRQVFWV